MKTSNISGTSDMPRIYPLRKPESGTIHLPHLTPPPRGARGAVRIGELLAPLQRIIEHPDRNRLLADFARRYGAE
jgi:hypothetical protein